MKIIRHKSAFPKNIQTSVVVGSFDGVHRGHQKAIKHAITKAEHLGVRSVVVTFEPHPMKVLSASKVKPLLTKLEHKMHIVQSLGPEYCYIIRFSSAYARQSAEDFVRNVLIKTLNVKHVTVGFNFRFGHNREGDGAYLQNIGRKLGFGVTLIKPVCSGKEIISSTSIRQALSKGDLAKAQRFLGRKISLKGRVVAGDGRGRKYGFPTANILLNNEVLPPVGVYLIRAFLKNNAFNGLMNIGPRPGFLKSKKSTIRVEVHLLDFNKDIYGQGVILEIQKYLRTHCHFDSINALVGQVRKDIVTARKYFSRSPMV